MDAITGPKIESGQTVDLPVSGMHCASCVRRVEQAARDVPGILDVSVNLATERAHLTVLPGFDEESLATALRRAGFDLPKPAIDAAAKTPFDRQALAAGAAILLALTLLIPDLPVATALLLATAVQIAFGARFYRGALSALRHGAGSMDTLVALGTTASFGLSLWAVATAHPRSIDFAAGPLVIAFVTVGKWLEASARRHAAQSLRDLSALRPERAHLRVGDRERDILATDLRPGDLLAVRSGERFPADGLVRDGNSSADESLLTGEFHPVPKQPGDRVTGGALNHDGLLLVEATATGGESRLAQLVRLVESAGAAKPPIQRLVDRVSAIFVPAVIAIALATCLGWALAGAPLATAALHAVSVLVIACPCALGLATPAAIVAGTGAAARHGILIRDPLILERARRIRDVVFDKTGTLTEGRPQLAAVAPPDRPDLVACAASLAAGSNHPLAHALLVGTPAPIRATDIRTLPGRGIEGTLNDARYLLGSERLLRERGFDLTRFDATLADAQAVGHTVSFLAGPGGVLALFAFADQLKPNAARAIAALGRRHRVHMLTGDTERAARAVAAPLGMTDIHAGALPEDKVRLVASLRPVVFVGDGLNDAAALAAADIGIAFGAGADLAASAAGVTLLRDDPLLVPAALDIARRTHRTIATGLFWAFVYNLVGLPLAAFGILPPALAGGAMALSSLSVVANALLLRRWRPS